MRGYQKVSHLGSPTLDRLLEGNIHVEEKIDGSQFRFEIDAEGKLHFGSRRVDFDDVKPDPNFRAGMDKVEEAFKGKPMIGPITVFAEYMKSEKHNTLKYDRVPKNHIAIFDVLVANGTWLSYDDKKIFAEGHGFEVVPKLWEGDGKELSADKIHELLKTQSCLGGTEIEGVVVKNYNVYYDAVKYAYLEGMWQCGKFVRAEFTEKNMKNHREGIPKIDKLCMKYNNEARWNKAIFRLRDESKLSGEMKDMTVLTREVVNDVSEECKDEIKEELYKIYGNQVIKSSIKGLPEFYKNYLLEQMK